jgi:beta-glucosidase/6-phospho-beta-glucosidase/beta-galactosidase
MNKAVKYDGVKVIGYFAWRYVYTNTIVNTLSCMQLHA